MYKFGSLILITSLLVTFDKINQIDAANHRKPALSTDTLEAQYGHIKYAGLLFRHGERTPTRLYPTDPHKNYTWSELGELTNTGKRHEYDLGSYFKPRYSHLTGKSYKSDKVAMRASNTDRCLMSAELFLASYFPPSKSQVWNKKLLWQPIPVDTTPSKHDNVVAMRKPCPRRDQAEKDFYATDPIVKKICTDWADMFLYIQNHTGLNMSKCTSGTFRNVISIQDTLQIESNFGLKLPEWTREVFPEPLTQLRGYLINIEVEDRTVAKLMAGPLLSVIAADMNNIVKVNHTIPEYIYTKKPTRPLHLFSGHDGTIVTLLRALNMYQNVNPPYGAALGFELRSKGESHYVMAVYEHSIHRPLQTLEIPGCSGKCSLTNFMDLIRPLIPENWEAECQTGEIAQTNSTDYFARIQHLIEEVMAYRGRYAGPYKFDRRVKPIATEFFVAHLYGIPDSVDEEMLTKAVYKQLYDVMHVDYKEKVIIFRTQKGYSSAMNVKKIVVADAVIYIGNKSAMLAYNGGDAGGDDDNCPNE